MRSRPARPLYTPTAHITKKMVYSREDYRHLWENPLSLSLSLLQLKPTRVEFSCKEDEDHGEDKGFLSVLGEFLKNELLGQ